MNRRGFLKRSFTAIGLALAVPLMPSVGREEPTSIAFKASTFGPEAVDVQPVLALHGDPNMGFGEIHTVLECSTSMDGVVWSEWGNFLYPPGRLIRGRIRLTSQAEPPHETT